MNKRIFILTLIFLSLNISAYADDAQQVITLKDGSQIKGTLSGIDNGTYTIKTPIIGDVHVAATDVSSITNGAPVAALAANAVPAPATTTMNQQIASAQQLLMSNPQNMAMIQQMAQDPQISQALQDPALQQAVNNHDYGAVMSNPAVKNLLSNPQMAALLKQLAAEKQQVPATQ